MVFGRNGIRPLVFKMSSIFYVLNADSGQYADTFISYIPGWEVTLCARRCGTSDDVDWLIDWLTVVCQREIDKLATLCLDRGATDEEISHCRVRREWINTVLPSREYRRYDIAIF